MTSSGNVSVGSMPGLGVGDDLGVGEAAHLAADRLESLVEAGIADCPLRRLRDNRASAARFSMVLPP